MRLVSTRNQSNLAKKWLKTILSDSVGIPTSCVYDIQNQNAAAVVHFNFSTPELVISEGGDLPSQLFISKTGQHQGNITVEVVLTSTFQNQNGMCGESIVLQQSMQRKYYYSEHIIRRL